jgi:hypothetical protein
MEPEMRISKQAYDVIGDEIRQVIAKMDETDVRRVWGHEIDPDNLTIRMMWDLLSTANMDRSHQSHPRHEYPGELPRALEFNGRSHHWLYDRDGENLDDSHIRTALKSIMNEISAEREVRAHAAPAPRM